MSTVSPAWRRAGRRVAAGTAAAATVMFAASLMWSEWAGWLFLPWAAAPAPLVLWLASRTVLDGAGDRLVVVGLGIGALVQLAITLVTVDQALGVIHGIRLTSAPAESLYGLVVLVAPLYVAPAPLAGLLAALTLDALAPAADPRGPR